MIVDNLFMDIFMSVHKSDRITSMKKLPKKELYLLLLLIFDKHNKENENIKKNCRVFKEEAIDIYQLLDTGDTKVPELLELIRETKDLFINLSKIKDENGNPLPDINDINRFRNYRLKILKE